MFIFSRNVTAEQRKEIDAKYRRHFREMEADITGGSKQYRRERDAGVRAQIEESERRLRELLDGQ